MTGGDFLELQKMALGGQAHGEGQSPPATPPPRYVYGLRGIRELFGVSHATAQKLKDGILKPAVRQYGRKIVVDADMAMELFNNKNGVQFYGRKNQIR